jgi:hypothetical protein
LYIHNTTAQSAAHLNKSNVLYLVAVDDPDGQNVPTEHKVGLVTPALHLEPLGHTIHSFIQPNNQNQPTLAKQG